MTKTINFKFDYLLWFIILAPTFYISGTETRTIQLEFFKLSVIASLAFFHVNRYFGIFIGYLLFQFMFFGGNASKAYVIPNIFFAGVLYHFIVSYAKISKAYLWAFYGVLLLSVFWIPIQMAQIDPIWTMADSHIQTLFTEYSGWFSLPAFMGNYAAVVLPFAFLLNPLLIVFALVALFYSKSTFSVIAALCGALFFLWFKKRIFFWATLLVFGISVFTYVLKYDLPSGQFGRRVSVWGLIVKESFTKQFFGHGIGAYGNNYKFIEFSPSLKNKMVSNEKQLTEFLYEEAGKEKIKEVNGFMAQNKIETLNPSKFREFNHLLEKNGMDFHDWYPAHNEFLQVFFDFGLIGILIIGAYVFDIFKRFFMYANNELSLALMSSFIAILIISIAHFPFQIARLSAPFLVILAFLDLSLRKNDPSREV